MCDYGVSIQEGGVFQAIIEERILINLRHPSQVIKAEDVLLGRMRSDL